MAQRLWIDHAIIRDVKKRLINTKLIDANWQPISWNKRQFKSDSDGTAAERNRNQRIREKERVFTELSRVTVTESPCVTIGNVTRTDTETKAKAKAEKSKSIGAVAPKLSPVEKLLMEFGIAGQLARDFITHRKHCGKEGKSAPITHKVMQGYR